MNCPYCKTVVLDKLDYNPPLLNCALCGSTFRVVKSPDPLEDFDKIWVEPEKTQNPPAPLMIKCDPNDGGCDNQINVDDEVVEADYEWQDCEEGVDVWAARASVKCDKCGKKWIIVTSCTGREDDLDNFAVEDYWPDDVIVGLTNPPKSKKPYWSTYGEEADIRVAEEAKAEEEAFREAEEYFGTSHPHAKKNTPIGGQAGVQVDPNNLVRDTMHFYGGKIGLPKLIKLFKRWGFDQATAKKTISGLQKDGFLRVRNNTIYWLYPVNNPTNRPQSFTNWIYKDGLTKAVLVTHRLDETVQKAAESGLKTAIGDFPMSISPYKRLGLVGYEITISGEIPKEALKKGEEEAYKLISEATKSKEYIFKP